MLPFCRFKAPLGPVASGVEIVSRHLNAPSASSSHVQSVGDPCPAYLMAHERACPSFARSFSRYLFSGRPLHSGTAESKREVLLGDLGLAGGRSSNKQYNCVRLIADRAWSRKEGQQVEAVV